MSLPFDPYHKWLGIPPAEQPPHHYRLLGLALFEHDGDVIEIAADQRMALLRSFHTGPHADLSQKLLNEVAAARLTLLKPDRRQRYDEILRARFNLKDDPKSSTASPAPDPKSEAPPQAKAAAADKPAANKPAPITPAVSKPASDKPAVIKTAAPTTSGASPSKAAAASPGMVELVGKSAKKSREIELAPRSSDWDRAISDACSTQTVVRRRRRRWHVNESLVQFIIGAAIIGGLVYGGSVGFRMWQDAEFKRANLASRSTKPAPPPAATSTTAPASDGSSSSDSSPSEADTERTPAPNFGSRRSPNVPSSTDPNRQPAQAGPNSSEIYSPTHPNPGGDHEPSAVRYPVPSPAAQKKAADEINDVLKENYRQAVGVRDKVNLAHYLLRLASETHDDPVKHYVLDDQALVMAIKFGDVPCAAEVVRDMIANYQVDAWELRKKTLNELARVGSALVSRAALAEAAYSLVDDAIAEERYDTALDFANLSLRLAISERISARANELRDQAREAIERVKQTQKRQMAVEEANSTLAANPDDAAANLVIGKYKCLIKQDWQGGLPYLAKAGDDELRKLAERELQPPTQAAAQMELADAWWELAQRRQDPKNDLEYKGLRARAAYWYRAAIPNLSGISQAKAIKRAEAP
jgi:hypothetical protein